MKLLTFFKPIVVKVSDDYDVFFGYDHKHHNMDDEAIRICNGDIIFPLALENLGCVDFMGGDSYPFTYSLSFLFKGKILYVEFNEGSTYHEWLRKMKVVNRKWNLFGN